VGNLPGRDRAWHLVEKPRSPFRCDVCGATIPDHEASSFTTLPKMYYDTPPAGYVPCNRTGYDAWSAEYSNVADRDAAPAHGGRFVFTREGETTPVVYRVEVLRAGVPTITTSLRWDDADRPVLEPEIADAWARDETLKLARVLHRDPKPRLSRWRG
jgi:hypothetical protein